MSALVQFRDFSEDGRRSLGGHVSYDTAAGNRMPEETVRALTMLIELILDGPAVGEFSDVMLRFEQGLADRIENGVNVTDFQLCVAPYIPGRGYCPLPVKDTE